jgi:hypothetical protein
LLICLFIYLCILCSSSEEVEVKATTRFVTISKTSNHYTGWVNMASMLTPRSGHGMVEVGEDIFFCFVHLFYLQSWVTSGVFFVHSCILLAWKNYLFFFLGFFLSFSLCYQISHKLDLVSQCSFVGIWNNVRYESSWNFSIIESLK